MLDARRCGVGQGGAKVGNFLPLVFESIVPTVSLEVFAGPEVRVVIELVGVVVDDPVGLDGSVNVLLPKSGGACFLPSQ